MTDLKGRIYVGSSNDIDKRRNKHFNDLRKIKHCNKKLQDYFKKYGESGFSFSVIDLCDDSELLSREQYFIDTLKPWYNVNLIAAKPPSPLGRKHSEVTLEKMRLWNTGRKHDQKTLDKMKAERNTESGRVRQRNNGNKKHEGKVKKVKPKYNGVTDETRNKMRVAQTGRKHSAESIEKMREVRRLKWADPEYRKLGVLHLNKLSEQKRKWV